MVIEIKMSEIISINQKKKKKIHYVYSNNKEREIISIVNPLILWNWKLLKIGPKKMKLIRQ